MQKQLSILLILIFKISLVIAQPTDSPSPKKEGKCYAKCLITGIVEKVEEKFIPIYTGTDTKQDFVEKQKIVISEATTKWVKRKADKNCLSDDPNDCLVWCLVEVPAEIFKGYVVTDTSLTKDYRLESISKKEIIKGGGYTEWKEVLCEHKITPDLVRDLKNALQEAGYDPGPIDGIFKTKIKIALTKYQKDNILPVGNLNIATMKALGITY